MTDERRPIPPVAQPLPPDATFHHSQIKDVLVRWMNQPVGDWEIHIAANSWNAIAEMTKRADESDGSGGLTRSPYRFPLGFPVYIKPYVASGTFRIVRKGLIPEETA